MTGKCGSVQVRLIPAPRGTGIVGAPVPKKLLQMAGIEDCYTSARGSTGTLGNFGKVFPCTTMQRQLDLIILGYLIHVNKIIGLISKQVVAARTS